MRRILEQTRRGAAITIGLGALLVATASPAVAHNLRIDHSGAVFQIYNSHYELSGCRIAGWQQVGWAEVVYRNGTLKRYPAASGGGACMFYYLDKVGPVRVRACSDPENDCTRWYPA